MIEMTLALAAQTLQASLHGDDRLFHGCSTDTRTLANGQLFIAIKGENFDGHDFLATAGDKGAAGALVSKHVDAGLPYIRVADVRRAMGQLASAWRQRLSLPLVAITGSNGKTTVKEMVTAILRQQAPVLSTHGNLNNDIGVPITLYGLGNEHAYAVIEMGANHPGEIAWLSEIARPDVAVITQCAPAHLEGFGSVAGVARAKAEIYSGLQPGGTAIINTDDDYAAFWRTASSNCRQLAFGMQQAADITATRLREDDAAGSEFLLQTPAGSTTVQLPLPGRHNVMNALAAAACACALDIAPEQIRQGLQSLQGVKGRLQIRTGPGQSILIDDTYNANPASLQAALQVLVGRSGRHWLVLGDMGELGADAIRLHAEAGQRARQCGVERLFALGPLSRAAVEQFGHGAEHFDTLESLLAVLQKEISADVQILVKGSRAMQMERVVQSLEVSA